MGARFDDDAADGPEGIRPGDEGASGTPRDDEPPVPPGADDEQFDARWASLVEQLRDLDSPDLPSGRTAERPRVVRPARGTPRDAPAPASPERSGRDWDGTEQIEAAEREVDEQEHFVPGDPGPVLGGDPMLTLAWLVLVTAPLLWLVALVAWRDAPRVLVQGSGVAFVAAVGALVWRMPRRRDDDDDGAVV